MKPILLIMAAGLGSRYGGLKQIDPIGPHGEILLEFAIQDMIRLGAEKVVCVVSESIKQDFETLIRDKYASKITIELVVQSMQDTPDAPHTSERTKPWGTGHAVWCARHALDAPFIVINADDFYGQDAIRSAYEHLLHHADNDHCIVSYPLKNTLSEYGTVSRGVCTVEQGKLSKIVEHTKIARKSDGSIVHTCEDGHEIVLSPETPVSMNLFGFQRHFISILDRECQHFFEKYGYDEKREFFLPSVVMEMIKNGEDTVEALTTSSEWFGMTYPEDRQEAKEKIKKILS